MKHLWAMILLLIACGPAGEARSAATDTTQDTSSAAEQQAAPIDHRDRVLGLLSLPQVFGTEPCQPFTPVDVPLYASADSSQPIGRIAVDSPWTIHPDGGCEGLAVKVHRADADPADLPTLEYSYEAPGAIVLQHNGAWYRIRLADGAAWTRATEQNRFYPLEALLAENLAYIANPDGTGLAAAPGTDRSAAADLLTADRPVNVLGTQRVGEALWLRVAVQSHSVCEGLEEPATIAEGWLPAHTGSDEPIVWFYARGC